MAGRAMASILVLVMATLLHCASAQKRHDVGGNMAWTVPTGGATAYSTWAANQTFAVGDTLVFTFRAGIHDAAKVTKTAFDGCSATNPISRRTTSPATFTLDTAGEHYFLCTFPQHCQLGQKLAIKVTGSSSSGPSPSPKSPPSTTPSPKSSAPEAAGATPPSTSDTAPSGTDISPSSPGSNASPPSASSSPPALAMAGFFVAVLSAAMASFF